MNTLVIIFGFFFLVSAYPFESQEDYDDEPEPLPRIFNGLKAKPNQFKYQVLIKQHKIIEGKEKFSNCGGALISSLYVLTAAHCLENAVSAKVFLGKLFKNQKHEKNEVEFHVKKDNIIIHEEYVQKHHLNDIALIKLPKPVQFSKSIQPLELSKPDDDFSNDIHIVSGWGRLNDNNDDSSKANALMYTHVRQIPITECIKIHEYVTNNQVCTVNPKGQTCSGDSGSVMVAFKNDIPIGVGIVSYGKRPCQRDAPKVLTRIAAYRDWIAEHSDVKL